MANDVTELPARTSKGKPTKGGSRNVAGLESNTVDQSVADASKVLGTTNISSEQSMVVNLLVHLIGEHTKTYDRLESKFDRLESKFDRMSARMETRFDQMVDQFSDLRSVMSELDKKATATEKDVSILKTDVAKLTTDMAGVKSDILILKSDVGSLKSDVGTLKVEVGDLRKDLTIAYTDIEKIKTSQQWGKTIGGWAIGVNTSVLSGLVLSTFLGWPPS